MDTTPKKEIDPFDQALAELGQEAQNNTAVIQRPALNNLQGVPKMRYSEAQVLEAVMKSGGSMRKVMRRLGKMDDTKPGWYTAKRHVEAYPQIKEIFDGLQEVLIDHAQECVLNAIKSGDVQAAQYILSTVGKKRGFTTRTEVQSDHRHIHVIISEDEANV
jgi:hypothetical protein